MRSPWANRARLTGLNIVGLRRRGFSREDIRSLRTAYGPVVLAGVGPWPNVLVEVAELFKDHAGVMDIINFIREDSHPADVHAGHRQRQRLSVSVGARARAEAWDHCRRRRASGPLGFCLPLLGSAALCARPDRFCQRRRANPGPWIPGSSWARQAKGFEALRAAGRRRSRNGGRRSTPQVQRAENRFQRRSHARADRRPYGAGRR